MKKNLAYFSAVVIIIVAWAIWAVSINNNLLAPSPIDVLVRFGQLFTEGKTYVILGNTIGRLIIALLASFGVALVFGVIAGTYQVVEYFLKPIVTICRCLPVVAVVIIIWMAANAATVPFVIVFLIIFPIIYQAILDGIKNVISHETMDVYKLDSNISLYVIWKIHIPYIIPYIALSLMQGIGIGVKALVTAEFMVQTKMSVGRAIAEAQPALELATVFAWAIILITIVMIFEFLITMMKNKLMRKD